MCSVNTAALGGFWYSGLRTSLMQCRQQLLRLHLPFCAASDYQCCILSLQSLDETKLGAPASSGSARILSRWQHRFVQHRFVDLSERHNLRLAALCWTPMRSSAGPSPTCALLKPWAWRQGGGLQGRGQPARLFCRGQVQDRRLPTRPTRPVTVYSVKALSSRGYDAK
jgi:hypothetical protein